MLDENAAPRSLLLPPPYTAHWLPKGDVMAEACRRAPEEGAGTLVWHLSKGHPGGREGRLDFAVVLEPDSPLHEARRAFIAGMVALGDALAAHCPPERAVNFGWPGEVTLDTGRLGGMRFAVAPETAEDMCPDWIVLAVELIADRDHLSAPGTHPGSVSLQEEEFADPAAVLESFAAYLMLMFDRWTHTGFEQIAARYAERLGTGMAVSADGALHLDGTQEPLAQAIDRWHWRDAQGPRL